MFSSLIMKFASSAPKYLFRIVYCRTFIFSDLNELTGNVTDIAFSFHEVPINDGIIIGFEFNVLYSMSHELATESFLQKLLH